MHLRLPYPSPYSAVPCTPRWPYGQQQQQQQQRRRRRRQRSSIFIRAWRAGGRASGAVPRESRQASRRCRWVSAVDRSPAARNDAGVSLMLFVVTDRASRIRRRPGRAGPRAGCTVPARARLGCTASDPRRQSIGRRRHPLLRCKSTAVACCCCCCC